MLGSDYWNALGARQRAGLFAGVALVLVGTAVLAVWLMRDPYVALAAQLTPERASELARELEAAHLDFRLADSGDELQVPRSQLGRARASVSGAPVDAPPNVGLELFKDADFSATDFTQRINYQRALQGELSRTLQSMAGIRSARVHLVLPEGGLFKRESSHGSAAVSVIPMPGATFGANQVRGIQRLVAASVPSIRVEDVVVLDDSGRSLTSAVAGGEEAASSAQLELKRQADQYLEGKLRLLLQDLAPLSQIALSVDTVLEDKQSRVTTDEPIAARSAKDTDHPSGVMSKERRAQRGAGSAESAPSAQGEDDSSSLEWEHEYVVGHRTEQTQAPAGAIRRLSVAVALKGAPPDLAKESVEQLIANAVGLDRARGDAVTVLLLPGESRTGLVGTTQAVAGRSIDIAATMSADPASKQTPDQADSRSVWKRYGNTGLILVIALVLGGLGWILTSALNRTAGRGGPSTDAEVASTVAQVKRWLSEGGRSGAA